MAKTMPSPRIPFVYDFATSERKKLNAYRALARQIEDLPADIQAEIAARIERAEELLGDNPDVYASLSAITGITVLETIEQSARHKDSVGKSISITLNPEQLSSVKRKMESLDGLISRLEGFKRDVVGQGDVNNTEYWTVLSNRIVKEVQHVLDDAYLFENKEIKETAGRLSQRTDDLVKEVNEAQKLKGEDIERLETVTKDDYWKSKDVDTKLVDIDEETGQMSGFSKDLQDDYNRMKINQGANIVNDISGLNFDSKMIDVVKNYNVPIIIMHIKGTPKNMQLNPTYDNIVDEIIAYFNTQINLCLDYDIPKSHIILDPGIGFGKQLNDNFILIRELNTFADLGYPILIGPSRKSFIGLTLDLQVDEILEGGL